MVLYIPVNMRGVDRLSLRASRGQMCYLAFLHPHGPPRSNQEKASGKPEYREIVVCILVVNVTKKTEESRKLKRHDN